MKSYRIYCLNSGGQIARALDVQCQDDLAALAEGEKSCTENDVEVWEGTRLVARVKKGGTPLSAEDSQSL